jgi:hypothetical protein
MKKLLLTSIAALLLATGTAHANPDSLYPKPVKTKPAGVTRECATKLSIDGKLENERELKTCVKNWNATIANPAKGHWKWNWPPPAEYDKPYEGILMFQRLPLEQIQKICVPGQIGCAMPISTFNGGKQWQINMNGNRVACVIFLVPDSYLKEHHQDPKDAIRHETAHCNGWPADHPNSQSKWEWVEK